MIVDKVQDLCSSLEVFKRTYNENEELLDSKTVIRILLLEYMNHSIKLYRINKLTYEDLIMIEYIKELHNKIIYIFETSVTNEYMENMYSYILSILYDLNHLICSCYYNDIFDNIEFKTAMFKYTTGVYLHMRVESALEYVESNYVEEYILNILELI